MLGRTFPISLYVVSEIPPHGLKQRHELGLPPLPTLPILLRNKLLRHLYQAFNPLPFIPAFIRKGTRRRGTVCDILRAVEGEESW